MGAFYFHLWPGAVYDERPIPTRFRQSQPMEPRHGNGVGL